MVTRYATPRDADPFAASRALFESLIGVLEEGPATGMTHTELEDLLTDTGRELLRRLLQDHLDLRAIREERELTERLHRGERPGGRTRLERGHHRALATVVGTVTVHRAALRASGQANLYPADAALSLPAGRASHGVRKQAVLEAVRSSYDTTRAAIGARCGPVAGKRQLEHLVAESAVDIGAFYTAQVPAPAGAGTLLVLSVDAKGIVMRPDALREATRAAATPVFRTRLASGEKPNRKRMATPGGGLRRRPRAQARPRRDRCSRRPAWR